MTDIINDFKPEAAHFLRLFVIFILEVRFVSLLEPESGGDVKITEWQFSLYIREPFVPWMKITHHLP